MKFPDAGLEAQPLAEVGWHGLVYNGTGKADQSDLQPGTLDDRGSWQEHVAAVLAIAVCRQHRIGQRAGELFDPVRTKGELPMKRHGLHTQLGYHRNKSFSPHRNRKTRPMKRLNIFQATYPV